MISRAVCIATTITIALAVGAVVAVGAAASDVTKYFDVTKPSTIRGMVGGISHTSKFPYVLLMLATEDDAGNRRMKWVVKGDTKSALEKAGWKFGPKGTIDLGVTISIKAFPLKPGVNALEAIRGAGPELMAVAKTGGLVHGVEVILADGKKLYFGPAE
jgi:hypothetical protein